MISSEHRTFEMPVISTRSEPYFSGERSLDRLWTIIASCVNGREPSRPPI